MAFEGKVVAITGGASGMGLATARILAERGAAVALADVQSGALEAVAAELAAAGKQCMTSVVDVTRSADVDAWIAAVMQRFGRLDGAVNCAGILYTGQFSIVETSDEEWHRVQSVNLSGVFYCLRAQLRVMKKGASIVSISSVSGLRSHPMQASYSVSKHGVIGLTKSAAKEAGPDVRVNCVCPGLIMTPLVRSLPPEVLDTLDDYNKASAAGRAASPEEVAKVMVFLLSDEASFITGASYTVDGGLTT